MLIFHLSPDVGTLARLLQPAVLCFDRHYCEVSETEPSAAGPTDPRGELFLLSLASLSQESHVSN